MNKLKIYINQSYKYLEPILEDISNNDAMDIIIYQKENEYDAMHEVATFIQTNRYDHRAIVIDDYGIFPFMMTTKYEGIICAQLSDEHSALMTRDHNNSNVISLGAEVVGPAVIKSIVHRFITHKYAGGRHQIRIDMLNSMGGV